MNKPSIYIDWEWTEQGTLVHKLEPDADRRGGLSYLVEKDKEPKGKYLKTPPRYPIATATI